MGEIYVPIMDRVMRPPLRFRHNVIHRQATTTCLETLAFIVGLYHFATGGYLTVRQVKEWFLEERHQVTYLNLALNETLTIQSPTEAYDYLILPFACRTAYQALSCALGMFLANGIGHKSELTFPKCKQWLLWTSALNVNTLLLLYTHIDFYVLCWNVSRVILEMCVVLGFTLEVMTDHQEAAMRQEILNRFRARADQI